MQIQFRNVPCSLFAPSARESVYFFIGFFAAANHRSFALNFLFRRDILLIKIIDLNFKELLIKSVQTIDDARKISPRYVAAEFPKFLRANTAAFVRRLIEHAPL